MAASATFIPTITEATPLTARQREAAARGHRGFRVQASGNTRINGLKVVAWLVQVYPDGYIRCYCPAASHNHDCPHKRAARVYLAAQEQGVSRDALTADYSKPVLPLTKAERREAAVLETTPAFSIYRS
jgi:hypothetical protein